MKNIILLFLTLFVIREVEAQSDTHFIKNTLSKIQNCKTIRHNSLQKWGNIGDKNDYTPNSGVVVFKINLADTIIKSNYYLSGRNITDIYEGSRLLRLDSKELTFEEEKIEYTNDEQSNVKSKMLYTGSIMDIYNILLSTTNKKFQKKILTKDSVFNNIKVKSISIIYSDTIIDGHRAFYQKEIIVDKSTNLPLYFASTSVSVYGTQIISCQLSDFRFNAVSDMQMFKSIKIPPKYKAYQNQPISETRKLVVNQQSPKLDLPLVQGGRTSIEQNNGKIILLEFSGVHCGFCLVAVKDIIKIRNKYKSNSLEILSVYSDESHEKLKKYIDRYKINYPILFNDSKEKDKILSEFGVSGIPHFVIIGKDGTIKWNEVGYSPDLYNKLCSEIERQMN